jgi:hypothetical protein
MRDFALSQRFDCVIIPAHTFQFMVTVDDKIAALQCAHRHLERGGRLVVHIDRPTHRWMASLAPTAPPIEEWQKETVRRDCVSGAQWRRRSVWTLDPLTDVATFHSVWSPASDDDSTIRVSQDPMRLKIIGRGEMEHALRAAGFHVDELWGSFDPVAVAGDVKQEMIWVATRGQDSTDVR